MSERGRLLGLDVGARRIGLAISDRDGSLATPYDAIERRGLERDIAAILKLVHQEEVGRIVVGEPLSLDGSVGSQAKRTLDFYEALKAASPVPVETWDERFSTVEAERLLRDAGVAPSRNRSRLDAAAAAVILQGYLDAHRQPAALLASRDKTMPTLTVGIIGHPLGHSISPAFQQAAFDHYGMDARYLVWETPADGLAQRVQSLRVPGVLGANVTVPHKEAVRSSLDSLSQAAQRTGAVNTIVNHDGLLEGHNTDVPGFLRALRKEGGFDPVSKRVLLLGAGGAARAVAYALDSAGVSSLIIANRTVERAKRLIQVLSIGAIAKVVSMERDALAEEKGWDLIVNTTTLGMWHSPAEGESPLPAGLIPSHALVYDLVYNPPETPLLREARKAGARTLGGLPMLVYQGAEAFQLWTGKEAPLEVMFEAARQALAAMGG